MLGRWRPVSLLLAVVLAVALTGCSALSPSEPPPQPTPPARSTASTPQPSETSTPAAPATTGRPVRDVPDVSPEGFVDPPPGSGLRRYQDQDLTWKRCGTKGLECATVAAPLDYADPDGQAITLALSRRKATATPRLGSLFINPGGPGGSGVDYVGYFGRTGLEFYDIVGWDPRGVGASTPVRCWGTGDMDAYLETDFSPETAAERTTLERTEQAFGRSCLQKSGALLAHVSTAETVRDLDLLRGLVGDEQLSFFGSSYGTEVGSRYAEMFPENVGRMVLDGAVDITPDDRFRQEAGFDRALTNFAAWCAGQDCRLGSSRAAVLKRITDFWRKLDADPVKVGEWRLTQSLAVTGVAAVLYENERAWPYLAQALNRAILEDNGNQLLLFALGYYQRTDAGYGDLIYAFTAIRCLDSQETSVAKALTDWRAARTTAPIYAPVSGPDLACPMWPVAPAPKQPTISGAGAKPIVVIGTTGDPATPYEQAVAMADQLKSGVLVRFEGEGHLAYGQSACVQKVVVRYLVEGRVPEDRTRC